MYCCPVGITLYPEPGDHPELMLVVFRKSGEANPEEAVHPISPADADIWEEARDAAEAFWDAAAAHPRISPGFQAIARENREKIAALRPLVALLPSSGR